jgi:hypothetical protein
MILLHGVGSSSNEGNMPLWSELLGGVPVSNKKTVLLVYIINLKKCSVIGKRKRKLESFSCVVFNITVFTQ